MGLTVATLGPHVEQRIVWLLDEILTHGQFGENSFELTAYTCALEKEKDGRLLALVLELAFRKFDNDMETIFNCGRLFEIMCREILPTMHDQLTVDPQGQPLRGTALFRKYLLDQWRRSTEQIWQKKEAAVFLSTQAPENQETVAATTKAVRHWLALLDFTNDLRGRYVLGESVLHEAITKQLSAPNPTELEISKLTALTAPDGEDARSYKMKDKMEEHYPKIRDLAKRSDLSRKSHKMLMVCCVHFLCTNGNMLIHAATGDCATSG
jgi:translation initiation factor 4G